MRASERAGACDGAAVSVRAVAGAGSPGSNMVATWSAPTRTTRAPSAITTCLRRCLSVSTTRPTMPGAAGSPVAGAGSAFAAFAGFAALAGLSEGGSAGSAAPSFRSFIFGRGSGSAVAAWAARRAAAMNDWRSVSLAAAGSTGAGASAAERPPACTRAAISSGRARRPCGRPVPGSSGMSPFCGASALICSEARWAAARAAAMTVWAAESRGPARADRASARRARWGARPRSARAAGSRRAAAAGARRRARRAARPPPQRGCAMRWSMSASRSTTRRSVSCTADSVSVVRRSDTSPLDFSVSIAWVSAAITGSSDALGRRISPRRSARPFTCASMAVSARSSGSRRPRPSILPARSAICRSMALSGRCGVRRAHLAELAPDVVDHRLGEGRAALGLDPLADALEPRLERLDRGLGARALGDRGLELFEAAAEIVDDRLVEARRRGRLRHGQTQAHDLVAQRVDRRGVRAPADLVDLGVQGAMSRAMRWNASVGMASATTRWTWPSWAEIRRMVSGSVEAPRSSRRRPSAPILASISDSASRGVAVSMARRMAPISPSSRPKPSPPGVLRRISSILADRTRTSSTMAASVGPGTAWAMLALRSATCALKPADLAADALHEAHARIDDGAQALLHVGDGVPRRILDAPGQIVGIARETAVDGADRGLGSKLSSSAFCRAAISRTASMSSGCRRARPRPRGPRRARPDRAAVPDAPSTRTGRRAPPRCGRDAGRADGRCAGARRARPRCGRRDRRAGRGCRRAGDRGRTPRPRCGGTGRRGAPGSRRAGARARTPPRRSGATAGRAGRGCR